MSMYFSASTVGFYSLEVHGPSALPADAIELAADEYRRIIEGLSEGKQIQPDATGRPVLVQASVPTVDARALIAARRYQVETGGITVNGMKLDTNRDSQALVAGAALAAVIDSAYRCKWKTLSGFIELDAKQIIAVASAMRAHVQACFDRESTLLAAMETGKFVESMLDEGWPQ